MATDPAREDRDHPATQYADRILSRIPGLVQSMRRERGLSIEDLAAKSNVPAERIRQIESGFDALIDELYLISVAMDCPVADFFAALEDK